MEDFPSNSYNKPRPKDEATQEPKKVQPIVSGEAIQRKKSAGRRFIETFFSGDAKSAGGYVLQQVLIPALRDMIADAGRQGIERIIYPDVRGGGRRSDSRGSFGHVQYNQPSRNGFRSDPRDNAPIKLGRRFDEIIIAEREEAVEILDTMNELVGRFGQATVADLYDMCRIKGSSTDNNWGWEDLRTSDIRRVNGGYLLEMPKPKMLD